MNEGFPDEKITLLSLFKHFFILSAFAFGGGATIISMIKERFVDRLKWVGSEELTDMLAMAQVAPGATTINVCVILAFRLKGIRGVIIAVVASVLPPLIVIIAIQKVFSFFDNNEIAQNVLHGIRSGAAAIIFTVVINMIIRLVQKKKISLIILLIAFFVAAYCFKVSVLILIAISVVIGIIASLIQRGNKTGADV